MFSISVTEVSLLLLSFAYIKNVLGACSYILSLEIPPSIYYCHRPRTLGQELFVITAIRALIQIIMKRLITLVNYCHLATNLLYSYLSGTTEPSFKVPSSISYLNSGLQKKTTKNFLKKFSLTRGFLIILAKSLSFGPSWGNVRSWWTLFSPNKSSRTCSSP